MCVQCQQRPKEGIKYPGIGVVDNCEPPGEYWELNPSPMQEQQVPLAS